MLKTYLLSRLDPPSMVLGLSFRVECLGLLGFGFEVGGI